MIPPQKRSGTSTDRCQMATPIMTQTKMLTDTHPGALARAAYIDMCRSVQPGVARFHGCNPVSAPPSKSPRILGLRRSTRTAASARTARSQRSPSSSICPPGPDGPRVIVRRERPHPGAQLSFTDHDGYRFQAILTDQPDPDIAILERPHPQRVEDRIRDDKDTGLAKFPFKEFALNQVWLEIVMLAHDLIVWTQALLLDDELAKAEPKRLRYRLLHVSARLAFHGRRGRLRLQHDWTCATALLAAFQKVKELPVGTG
jgi:hypothetical protein